jgi:hypothetical protein
MAGKKPPKTKPNTIADIMAMSKSKLYFEALGFSKGLIIDLLALVPLEVTNLS